MNVSGDVAEKMLKSCAVEALLRAQLGRKADGCVTAAEEAARSWMFFPRNSNEQRIMQDLAVKLEQEIARLGARFVGCTFGVSELEKDATSLALRVYVCWPKSSATTLH